MYNLANLILLEKYISKNDATPKFTVPFLSRKNTYNIKAPFPLKFLTILMLISLIFFLIFKFKEFLEDQRKSDKELKEISIKLKEWIRK